MAYVSRGRARCRKAPSRPARSLQDHLDLRSREEILWWLTPNRSPIWRVESPSDAKAMASARRKLLPTPDRRPALVPIIPSKVRGSPSFAISRHDAPCARSWLKRREVAATSCCSFAVVSAASATSLKAAAAGSCRLSQSAIAFLRTSRIPRIIPGNRSLPNSDALDAHAWRCTSRHSDCRHSRAHRTSGPILCDCARRRVPRDAASQLPRCP